jgi:hypothetical protein
MATYCLHDHSAFGPEEIRILAAAYEDARSRLRVAEHADGLAEMVAQSIIEIAREGEREPGRLCERALSALGLVSVDDAEVPLHAGTPTRDADHYRSQSLVWAKRAAVAKNRGERLRYLKFHKLALAMATRWMDEGERARLKLPLQRPVPQRPAHIGANAMTTGQYIKLAKECMDLAGIIDPQHRNTLVILAETWLRLANKAPSGAAAGKEPAADGSNRAGVPSLR